MAFRVIETGDECTFQVRVVPRSARNEVTGLDGEALRIRLVASPVDGKANRALQVFLAEKLRVSPSSVEILAGHRSRRKRVCVRGVLAHAVRALAGL